MAIRLDHTIVPARDKVVAAQLFADIFGLTVKPVRGRFAQVAVNESLTVDFADEAEDWGAIPWDPSKSESHHYAFCVGDAEFDGILGRVKARGMPFGSGPRSHTDGQVSDRRGGRTIYFEVLDSHLLEVMTVPSSGA